MKRTEIKMQSEVRDILFRKKPTLCRRIDSIDEEVLTDYPVFEE